MFTNLMCALITTICMVVVSSSVAIQMPRFKPRTLMGKLAKAKIIAALTTLERASRRIKNVDRQAAKTRTICKRPSKQTRQQLLEVGSTLVKVVAVCAKLSGEDLSLPTERLLLPMYLLRFSPRSIQPLSRAQE